LNHVRALSARERHQRPDRSDAQGAQLFHGTSM